MVPVELDGKTSWPRHKAQYALKQICRRHTDRFTARDMSLGVGTTCLVEQKNESGGPAKLVVDPVKSALRHSGQEHTDAVSMEWWEFCQVPQDSSAIDIPAVPRPTPKDPRSIGGFNPHVPIATTQTDSSASVFGITASNPEASNKKRGRPKKNRLDLSPNAGE